MAYFPAEIQQSACVFLCFFLLCCPLVIFEVQSVDNSTKLLQLRKHDDQFKSLSDLLLICAVEHNEYDGFVWLSFQLMEIRMRVM